MDFLPITRMRERLARDRDDADASYWWSLLYYGELVTKLVAAGFIACIDNDPDRLRYSQAHRLVRASGIGEWAQAIDEILTGPPAQYLLPLAHEAAKETTQKVGAGAWQYAAVHTLSEVVRAFDAANEPPPAKPALRVWFSLFARLRNKTRGHGAPLAGVLSGVCSKLHESLDLVANNHPLFALPWAHLRQNLSGKFRVSYLSEAKCEAFERLRRDRSEPAPDSVYLGGDRPIPVELMVTDPDLVDFYFPNGDFRATKYELLSYSTGATRHGDSQVYLASPKDLPSAETEGLGILEVRGQCFSNIPVPPQGYVRRSALEEQLELVLLDERRHVVTLYGPGGIGKTSLALTVLHRVALTSRFQVIVWFSARDIELLPHGPKPVRPKVLAEKDIAREYAALLEPAGVREPKFDAVSWMAHELEKTNAGPTLFVFDNFETVTSPEELFSWLDLRIRGPNKILITTRLRSFNGDYQVGVSGMAESESKELIDSTAALLGIRSLLTAEYVSALHREADGHPYVMKVLLGEVAKARKLVRLERIVGDQEHILVALFERTYERLSPAAKRLFLTIGRWRSIVPVVGLRAVVLRPQNERIDVDAALGELEKSSLVEFHVSEHDQQEFVSSPLAAALFAQRKLRADHLKSAIEADVQALRDFGALQETDLRHGLRPRVRQLFRAAADRVAKDPATLEADLPVLEFVARSFPDAWLWLADLLESVGGQNSLEKTKAAVRGFLEEGGADELQRHHAWDKMADLSRRDSDPRGELHAWAEYAGTSPTLDGVSLAASKINTVLRQRLISLDRDEKRVLVDRVLDAFEKFEAEASGTAFSRVAWLCCNVGDEIRARDFINRGLRREPGNEHLDNLATRLKVW